MIADILKVSFATLWDIEEQPLLDVVKYTLVNDPTADSDLDVISPYTDVQADVPYIYAGGTAKGMPEDNTTKTDLTIFFQESDLTFTINFKLLFKINSRLYKMADKDPNYIFGLVEIALIRGD